MQTARVHCSRAEVLSNNQKIPSIILNPDIFAIRHGPADSDYESDWSTWTRVHTETGQRRGRSDYFNITLMFFRDNEDPLNHSEHFNYK